MRLLLITLAIPLLSLGMEEPTKALTPLEERFLDAAKKNDLNSVKECLAQHVNSNVSKSYDGETALWHACLWGYYEIAELLLQQKDIEVNTTGRRACLSCYNDYTPLHLIFGAISNRRLTPAQQEHLLQLLLQKNADINALTNQGLLGHTVLSLAIEFANADNQFLVEQLIDAGVRLKPTGWNTIPLTQVIHEKKPALMPMLLKSRRVTKDNVTTALGRCANEYESSMHKVCQQAIKYAREDDLRHALELLEISLRAPAIIVPSEAPSLKALNKSYDELKSIITLCDIPNHHKKEKLEKLFDKVSLYRTMHTMLCHYYKAMRLLEHGSKTNLHLEWKASARFHLPTDLMKMIAYHTTTLT